MEIGVITWEVVSSLYDYLTKSRSFNFPTLVEHVTVQCQSQGMICMPAPPQGSCSLQTSHEESAKAAKALVQRGAKVDTHNPTYSSTSCSCHRQSLLVASKQPFTVMSSMLSISLCFVHPFSKCHWQPSCCRRLHFCGSCGCTVLGHCVRSVDAPCQGWTDTPRYDFIT